MYAFSNINTEQYFGLALLCKGKRYSAFGIFFLLWALLSPTPSRGAEDKNYKGSNTVDQIIVTATRRAENLQDVPISITTFSAQEIKAYQPVDLEDLSDHVPNMWMPASTEAGQSFITIRGINAGITRSTGRAVGVYIDGVYVNADTAMNIAMTDITRIEVLKGPQGTLFGRDTIGGAINITTVQPDGATDGGIQIDLGNQDLRQILARANLPLAKDILSLRLAAYKRDKSGYIANAFTGRKAGAEDHTAFSAQVSYHPNTQLTAQLALRVQEKDDRPNTMGEAITNIGSDTIPFTINLDQDEIHKQSAQSLSFNADYSFAKGHTLNWTTGWSHVDDFYLQDGDRLPLSITEAQFDGKAEEFSQEIRLTSPQHSRFDYLVGLYYLDAQRNFDPTFPVMGSAFLQQVIGIPSQFHPPDTLDGQRVAADTKSLAAFAHANFYLDDKLTVYGGIRYTHDRKTVDYNSFGEVFEVFGLPPFSAKSRVSDKPVSWMVGTRYQFHDEIMGYANISRGYRSAAIKDDFVSAADIAAGEGFFTKPEFVTNYETGIKSRFLDNKIRVNATAFFMDYTDIQASVSRPPFLFLQSLTNAAKAHISGFEADLTARLSNHLNASAVVGYVRTRYDEFSPSPGVSLAGTSFGTAPVWSLSTALDYHRPLTNGGELSAHIDYVNRTAPATVPPGSPGFVGDYGLANGWVGYEPGHGNWQVRLWVKNIADVNLPAVNKLWGAGLGPLIENETVRYEPPRTFGLSFSIQFGERT